MRLVAAIFLITLAIAPAADGAWVQGADGVEATVLSAAGSQQALAGGPGGALFRTADAGQSWQQLPGPGSDPIRALAMLDESIFAVDSRGIVRRTADAGVTWSDVRTGARAVAALGSDRIVVAGRRSLALSSDGGERFAVVTPKLARGDSVRALDTTSGGAVVASGPRALLVSADRGRTWRHLKLPPLARGDGLLAVDFTGSRVGFVLTSFRRLYRTRDAGHHWKELLGTGGAGAGIAFTDARRGWLAAPGFASRYDGTVMRTSDGGATWRPETVAPRFLSAVAASGSSAFAIANEGSSLFANPGGAAPTQVEVGFRILRRGRVVTIRGRTTPADVDRPLVLSMRSAGRWLGREVKRDPGGVFTARFRLTRTSWFVAHVLGNVEFTGAGTNPVRVRVRR